VIRVSVVASSEVVRAGLLALLQTSSQIAVTGTYSRLGEWEEGEHGSTLLVDSDGEDEPLPGAVFLIDPGDPAWITNALRNGIGAILPRTASGPAIVAAIEGVAAGLVVLHPEIARLVLPGSIRATGDLPMAPHQPLTARETEVLRMLAEGQGNKAIAWALNISEHTVKFHVASIFSKLNVTTRTEAVTLGVRLGLILL
jgi:NarL family two-component system response regulator YdfI